jgi:radical SAM superfamily enzyme YgiQ (UPF0313 family)
VPRFIDPFYDLGTKLLSVEKPARYSGGEYGSIVNKDALFRTVIGFPDLYEIGMSNQALRIIYKKLNEIPGVSCDRAFTPAPDFEALLENENVSLYGLDTGIALCDADLICLSLGYELGITGALTMLCSSGIPIRREARGSGDPVVMMGGPCVSNPLPYGRFVDAFWIGEAEAGFFELCEKLLERKKAGARREEILSIIVSHRNVWTPGKSGVSRAIYADFGRADLDQADRETQTAFVFPVSSIKTVQHHGAVEIMRGCPNGCRFCHAGIWYRPMRQKNADLVVREVDELVNAGGYREISLSSLSSGDYCYIDELAAYLNSVYGSRHVSFQLPSLRVSGFSLPLLEKIAEVRKSGLTFAVETPREMWQLGINKKVKLDEVVSILAEAKRRGFRGAKFYFMIGLPPANPDLFRGEADEDQSGTSKDESRGTENDTEEKAIVDFIAEAGRRSRGHFHINVGVFVPKPHTPYERTAQLDEDRAWRKLKYIMSSLKPLGHKVSIHDPFIAMLEGLIARGDERVGDLIEQAFIRGARLDPWSEYFRKDIWEDLFTGNVELVSSVLSERTEETLSWAVIEPGTKRGYLECEKTKSDIPDLTSPCIEKCTNLCGVCGKTYRVVKNNIQCKVKNEGNSISGGTGIANRSAIWRMLFSFTKTGSAVFIPHLGVIEVFSMALLRSGLQPIFTQGFNPHVKLDFASPAAVGTICDAEIASTDFDFYVEPERFLAALGGVLPAGFTVTSAETFAIPLGAKKHSLPALLYGSVYVAASVPNGASGGAGDCVIAADEKVYRQGLPTDSFPRRTGLLARNPAREKDAEPYIGYFDAYRTLYGVFSKET